MVYIDRPAYMSALEGYLDSPSAKVLTGMRRCGKSSLLAMLRERLLGRGVSQSQIISLDFDELENAPLANAVALKEYITAQAPPEDPYFVFLDEVQEVDQWERLVSWLLAQGRVSLYLAGSNAALLSPDSLAPMAGRYAGIEVAPLSFGEFWSFSQASGRPEADTARAFGRYTRQGGLPGLFAADYSDRQVRQILLDTYSAILARDIFARRQVRSPDLFTGVATYALGNVGNAFSTRRVVESLKAHGRTVTHQTVAEYLEALTEGHVLRKATRYDIHGRAPLQSQDKYYAGDHGLITGTLGYNAARLPGILENIVWAELRRRGYEVSVGRVGTQEVDFVATRDEARIYLQVSVSALDPAVYQREMAPLLAIKDSCPKYLLTLDDLAAGVDQGVRFVKLPEFLLAQGWSQ